MNSKLIIISLLFILFFGCSKEKENQSLSEDYEIYNYTVGEYLAIVKETKTIGNFELLKKDIQASPDVIKLSEIANNKTLIWLRRVKNVSFDSIICFNDSDCKNEELKCIGQCKVIGGEKDGQIYACRLQEWISSNEIVPVIPMGICMGKDKWPH